jgi:hypothetical protein
MLSRLADDQEFLEGSRPPAVTGRSAGLFALAWPVDVRAVLDGDDSDQAAAVVDAMDHPVVASAGAVQPGQAEPERLAGLARALGQ